MALWKDVGKKAIEARLRDAGKRDLSIEIFLGGC